MKFFQWPTNFENHLPFRFSVKICQACGECKPSPFANSLQRIGKHTAFAFGECKVNVYNFAPKLHKKACRLLNYEIWEPFKKFLHRKVGNFRKHKTTFILLFSLYAPPSRETSKGPWRSLVFRPKRWRLHWKPGSSRPPSVRACRPSPAHRPPAAAGPNVLK